MARADASIVDIVTASAAETERLGEQLGRSVRSGDVVALWGELGSGKTVLTKGIARGAGAAGPVTSPTFVIAHEYEGGLPVYHLDFYRLRTEDLPGVGWEEYLGLGGVVVIEWPDRVGGALPPERLDIRLEHAGESTRRIRISAAGARAHELLRAMSDAARA
jgi:tRNA threonylcarbamoyladenosine biosynthesis protein TsaE